MLAILQNAYANLPCLCGGSHCTPPRLTTTARGPVSHACALLPLPVWVALCGPLLRIHATGLVSDTVLCMCMLQRHQMADGPPPTPSLAFPCHPAEHDLFCMDPALIRSERSAPGRGLPSYRSRCFFSFASGVGSPLQSNMIRARTPRTE